MTTEDQDQSDDKELFDAEDDQDDADHAASQKDADEGSDEDEPEGEDQGAKDEESDKGEDEQSEPPADKSADKAEDKSEKMIPESRFKAALKDVTDKLDRIAARNAELERENVQVPDRGQDPEGYERHTRLELSKSMMVDLVPDYNEMMEHYQIMAAENPRLNEMVFGDKLPAKMAYDLAKADLEIREIREVRTSGEWKEFQDWKKTRAKGDEGESAPKNAAAEKAAQLTAKKASIPPNLARKATAVAPSKRASSDDGDDLFNDHHSVRSNLN